MPPQKQSAGPNNAMQPNHAPWVDEVQQSVAVNQALNQNIKTIPNDNFFVHQAGAYKLDGTHTATPFFSPPLAKFCSGNSCYFASWYVFNRDI